MTADDAAADGDVCADVELVVNARLLFGLVNSRVDWYRPQRRGNGPATIADAACAYGVGLAAPASVGRPRHGPPARCRLVEDELGLGAEHFGHVLQTGEHEVA